ncbi:MAG TPA: acetolactate synthase large subunit, partial [Desulfobacterales bacterium]|nr:acetolactate synthase large subunit [Desulfobacterales bacterium]
YQKRYAATDLEQGPDFAKLAEAYGAVGLKATKPQEVVSVLKAGLESPGPAMMDFWVAREECVYPMVPAGASITEMLLA